VFNNDVAVKLCLVLCMINGEYSFVCCTLALVVPSPTTRSI